MPKLSLEGHNRTSYLVTKKERAFQQSLEFLQPVGGASVFNELFLHLLLLKRNSDYRKLPKVTTLVTLISE